MQVYILLKTAATELSRAGVEESRLEAELLLQDCLGMSRSSLFLHLDQQVDPEIELQFQEYLSRRCLREPLQYILGSCEFWSLDFQVTPAVLIPRPETEFLIEHVLVTLNHEGNRPLERILDLCTGSGVIAVVLAKQYDQAAVTAVDCSLEALAVARKNILHHELAEQVDLVCSDLLSSFRAGQLFDVVVTNPPYVIACDLPGLQPEVSDWEPRLALSGGETGLTVINRICSMVPRHLKPGGWLFMEIGADIGEQVEQFFSDSNRYEQIRIIEDWSGRPRVLQAKLAK